MKKIIWKACIEEGLSVLQRQRNKRKLTLVVISK